MYIIVAGKSLSTMSLSVSVFVSSSAKLLMPVGGAFNVKFILGARSLKQGNNNECIVYITSISTSVLHYYVFGSYKRKLVIISIETKEY